MALWLHGCGNIESACLIAGTTPPARPLPAPSEVGEAPTATAACRDLALARLTCARRRSRRPRAGSRTRRSPRVEQVEPRLAVDGDQPPQQAIAFLEVRPAVDVVVGGVARADQAGVAPLVLGEHSMLPRARDRQRAKAAGRDPALPLN